MATISLCMIVKNEEKVLARCLNSVKEAMDEIILVDTGSEDQTKEIARSFTEHVYDFAWCGDFSAARNFSFSKATQDYQMWLDADDIIPPQELEKLILLKNALDPEIDIVMMKYIVQTDASGNPVLTSTRERLLKRSKGYCWQDPIHEFINLYGNISYSDIAILHQKDPKPGDITRNIKVYENLEAQQVAFTPRQLYYYARELKDHLQYEKSIHYFNRFLDTGCGWLEDNIAACYNMALCYRALGDDKNVLASLVKSFYYDSPRAEICSELGYYFKKQQLYKQAVDWFEIALGLKKGEHSGFLLHDYWGYIPHMELCVCYYQLSDIEKAKYHNEQALKIKPQDKNAQDNKVFFERIISHHQREPL